MTPMLEAILNCLWTELLIFLQTGKWGNHVDFCDSTLSPAEQAQKYITYQDRYSNGRLRQLPLHAAISHLAPLRIVKSLLRLYPGSIECPDSKGNLPLHIAFLTNAHDVSAFLLKAYPEALMVTNEIGDLPVECCQQIFRTVPRTMDIDDVQTNERKEILRIEQSIAHDLRRMSAVDIQLQDLKEDIQNISDYGRRQMRSFNASLSDEVYL